MTFGVTIKAWGTASIKRVETVKRGVAIRLFNAVIMDTPVDTGRLRANWQLSFDADVNGVLPLTDKTGTGVINRVTVGISKHPKMGDGVIRLTNNLPYAARIEYEGWSHTKAPQGMVRRNVTRFGMLLREEIKKRGGAL